LQGVLDYPGHATEPRLYIRNRIYSVKQWGVQRRKHHSPLPGGKLYGKEGFTLFFYPGLIPQKIANPGTRPAKSRRSAVLLT